jgi:hypothetical protein
VLYPAVAEAARRLGANAVGLIDVARSAPLNLTVDRVGITYSNGQSLGDASSPVQVSCSIVRGRPVPTRVIPEVVARVSTDLDPLDAVARVPADALAIVMTTWALSRFPLESRLRFLHRLDEAAAERPVASVSAHGGNPHHAIKPGVDFPGTPPTGKAPRRRARLRRSRRPPR